MEQHQQKLLKKKQQTQQRIFQQQKVFLTQQLIKTFKYQQLMEVIMFT